MGLFINSKKERLLKWQSVILDDAPSNKLICTEQQLIDVTQQKAAICIKQINDSIKLIESTKKPDVFFERYKLMLGRSLELCMYEPYMDFNVSPADAYQEAITKKQEAVFKFIQRYFVDTLDKADAIKTDKAKIGKFQKFYDSLQPYYSEMNEENIDYIETKYKAYTRRLKKDDEK